MENSSAGNEPVKPSRGKIIVYFLCLPFAWLFSGKILDFFEVASAGFYLALFFLGMIYLSLFYWTFRSPSDRFTFLTLLKQGSAVTVFLLLIHGIFTFFVPTLQSLLKPIETPFGTSAALGGIIFFAAILFLIGLAFYVIESSFKK